MRAAIGQREDGRVGIVVTQRYAGQTGEPTLRELSEALVVVWGTDFGVHSPTWLSRFTDMTRQAASYKAGRVLLAGDAAHVHYPFPDLDLVTADGPRRVFALLHEARPVLLNLGAPGSLNWGDHVIEADYDGPWELPVLGGVPAPTGVLIRPDGHVAWAGDPAATGLQDALTSWFG